MFTRLDQMKLHTLLEYNVEIDIESTNFKKLCIHSEFIGFKCYNIRLIKKLHRNYISYIAMMELNTRKCVVCDLIIYKKKILNKFCKDCWIQNRKRIYYCSKKCQKRDWIQRHKAFYHT